MPNNALLLSMLMTFVSGIVAIVPKFRGRKFWSAFVLCAGNMLGALGSLLFLLQGGARSVTLLSLPFFFRTDIAVSELSAFFFLLITTVSAFAAIYSIGYLQEKEWGSGRIAAIQLGTALFIFGMQGVVLATNAITFFFFWELMSIVSFLLVMSDGKKASVRAALLYFVMAQLGAAAILGGFLLLQNGGDLSMNFSALRESAAVLSSKKIALAALLFFFGFGSKAGLVPFHVWLPEAHPQAPSHISALLSGVMLSIALYGFVRTAAFFPVIPLWIIALPIVLGAVSAIYGVFSLTVETDVKRALAYSSIENMGILFLLFGLAMFFPPLQGLLIFFALFHVWNHAIFKSGLFLSFGALAHGVHSRNMEVMGGIARRMPLFSALILLLCLAAAALPPFGAFFGEWGMIHALIAGAQTALTGTTTAVLLAALLVVTLSAGIAVFGMVRLFAIPMLGAARSEAAEKAHYPSKSITLPIALLGVLIALSGLYIRFISPVAVHPAKDTQILVISSAAQISPLLVFAVVLLILFLVFCVRRIVSNKQKERAYHTWDCGQPITAGMEYTGTAFAAPIRFFFRGFLGLRKYITSKPVVSTNPWIRAYTCTVPMTSFWYERLFVPSVRLLLFGANLVKRAHTGRIQWYLFFILATLILCLMFVL